MLVPASGHLRSRAECSDVLTVPSAHTGLGLIPPLPARIPHRTAGRCPSGSLPNKLSSICWLERENNELPTSRRAPHPDSQTALSKATGTNTGA